jgi:hypothetical protein
LEMPTVAQMAELIEAKRWVQEPQSDIASAKGNASETLLL